MTRRGPEPTTRRRIVGRSVRRWWHAQATNRVPILLAVAIVGLLVVAQAAVRAVAEHRDDRVTVAIPPPTPAARDSDGEDHFPGAALLYAAETPRPAPIRVELPAPAPGSTGTVAPPPEPIGMAFAPEATTVVPARPFLLGRAAALDRGRALECLTAGIYYEAGNQSDDGERAVAQVILNRVRHPLFPATVCGVVYQGSEHAGCQFSFACDGSMTRPTSRTGWARAMRIGADALAGQVYAPVGLATHYHTYAVTPAWNRALVMTDAVGAHFFHRWKGYWGTPGAFRQPWSGHEPTPGPHARLVDPAAPSSPTPAIALAPPPASAGQTMTVATTIQPSPVDVGKPQRDPASSPLPESQVLDRWKDSGKPLR